MNMHRMAGNQCISGKGSIVYEQYMSPSTTKGRSPSNANDLCFTLVASPDMDISATASLLYTVTRHNAT